VRIGEPMIEKPDNINKGGKMEKLAGILEMKVREWEMGRKIKEMEQEIERKIKEWELNEKVIELMMKKVLDYMGRRREEVL